MATPKVRIVTDKAAMKKWWKTNTELAALVAEATEKIQAEAEASTPEPYFAQNIEAIHKTAQQSRSGRPIGFVRAGGKNAVEYQAAHPTLSEAVKPK